MIVAELEIFHSRPIAPTRRIALGRRNLPIEPAPGAGGVLLAGIVAHTAPAIEADLREGLVWLLEELAAGRRVSQPRIRHRYQRDQIGLLRATPRLRAEGDQLHFDFDDQRAKPVQLALAALYAAGSLPETVRPDVFDIIRAGLLWSRPVDQRFISHVMGGGIGSLVEVMAWNDPVAWALEILDLSVAEGSEPSKRAVQRRFRSLLREAHPDHGGHSDAAAKRIAELTEARRILLAG